MSICQTKYRFVHVACLLASVWLVFAVAPPALAQSNSYTGVDIVFLVDQSGSMERSDTNELRFVGPQFAIDWMGRTLLEYDLEHSRSFQIAVINFGGVVHYGLPATRIAPASDDIWETQFAGVSKQLTEESLPSSIFVQTDFQMAFREARAAFTEMQKHASTPRLRAIVFLTDGLPYTTEPDFSVDQHMKGLASYAASELPYPAYQIYVLGLNNADNVFYWQQVEDDWAAITHNQAQLVDSNRTMGSMFQVILGELTRELGIEPETIIQCGSVSVDPYLELLRLTVHKATTDSHVRVYDPKNNLVSEGQDARVSNLDGQEVWVRGTKTPIESITVFNPEPGYWRIECPTDQPEPPPMFKREVRARTQVNLPTIRPLRYLPVKIEYQVFGYGGGVLPSYEEPKYRLNARLAISAAEETMIIPLTQDGQSSSYVGLYTPTSLGEHKVSLAVRSRDPSGGILEIEQRDLGTLMVEGPQADLIVPRPPPMQFGSATLNLELVDSRGSRVPIPERMLSTLDGELTIEADGLARTLPLTLQSDGTLMASWTPYNTGLHRVHARVSARLDTGKPITMLDDSVGSVDVKPVAAKVAEETKASQLWASVIAIDLTDFAGQPVSEAPVPGYSLSVRARLGEGVEYQMQGQGEGRYMTTFRPIRAGTYPLHVIVETRETLSGRLVSTADLPVGDLAVGDLRTWPRRVLIATGIVFLGMTILLAAGWFTLKQRRDTVENARGVLTLLSASADSDYSDSSDLREKRQRKYRWTPKPGSSLRYILVEQSSKDAKAGQAYVTTVDKKEGWPQYERHKMNFGDTISLLHYFTLSFSATSAVTETDEVR